MSRLEEDIFAHTGRMMAENERVTRLLHDLANAVREWSNTFYSRTPSEEDEQLWDTVRELMHGEEGWPNPQGDS